MNASFEQSYIFTNTTEHNELVRLRLIEEIFDPATFKHLANLGVSTGHTCMEVGVGAGSVMRWFCDRVGETGKVVAVDLDPRFIAETEFANLEVRQGDICDLALEPDTYDFIHLRYVLVHVQQYEKAIANLIQALKPGGWILLEEPDFLTQTPVIVKGEDRFATIARVYDSILRMHEAMGINSAIARQMPGILQDQGLQNVSTATDQPLAPGGSPMAQMMKMSLAHIAEKLINTGIVSEQDIQILMQEQDNPHTWIMYYTTIATWATKT
jgi:SAM-dependent methyltransferase